jgi:putative spermidine/putrescine transport system ATP-binding protein
LAYELRRVAAMGMMPEGLGHRATENLMATGLQTLSLDRVSKRYGTATALDDVSLTVARGEFLTLLGPSGSGKTTMLMAIAGFVAPTSGRILLDGAPIQHLPPEKRDFGMVFQGYALFPHLTVARNVAFPLEVRGMAKAGIEAKVRQALDLVQLGALAERLPRQLSGGQQQRVALARALVFAPHLLLLDEPLSALDRKLRADMQIELKAFHRQIGLTFIYVTHDQEEALSMSDRIAILRDGRLLQLGTPTDLYEKPATRFVASFLGKSNFLAGSVVQGANGSFAYDTAGGRFVQAGAPPAQAGGKVLAAIRPERLQVLTEGMTAANSVAGTIAEFSYLGTSFHLLVDTAAGRLAVTVPTWRHGAPPAAGEKIMLGWDPDASICVEDDE